MFGIGYVHTKSNHARKQNSIAERHNIIYHESLRRIPFPSQRT